MENENENENEYEGEWEYNPKSLKEHLARTIIFRYLSVLSLYPNVGNNNDLLDKICEEQIISNNSYTDKFIERISKYWNVYVFI